ncbi:MAG: asparagine synthase (glutamine-hydrolyzing) [Candidatus Woesearchaeota archaeon]
MCGILGFNFHDKALVKEMMGLLSHRGPDQHGMYLDDNVSLGHQRLSIIDLSTKGKQPMVDEKNDNVIVFNGEIYNFLEIKRDLIKKGHKFNSNTDTEVILKAYAEYDFNCLKFFNGDFAFCIYDRKKKIFFLARDRLGIKPLYYSFLDKQINVNGDIYNKKDYAENFIFASEYKAILAYDFKRNVNKIGLSRYLTLRYNYGRETLIDNIFRVLPGEYIIFNIKTKKIQKGKYWQVNFDPKKITKDNEDIISKKILELMRDSVQKRLMSDVPLGVYLSGGIDSGSVVSIMNALGVKDIKTFSVGFGYGEETDEIRYGKLISDTFATDHREFIVESSIAKNLPKIIWHCDEPLADPALLPVFLLSKKTKPHATVVLTGDGGDEVFAGYEQNKFMQLGKLHPVIKNFSVLVLNAMPAKYLKILFKYAPKLGEEGKKRAIEFLRKKDAVDQYVEIVSIFNAEEKKLLCTPLPYIRQELSHYFNDKNNVLNQVLKLEYDTQLPENMLHKADRMSMAYSVESRVPFLDHRLVEYSELIPPNLKLKGFNEKYILRRAMRHLLPKEILVRKKQRFYVPIDVWIKKDLSPMIDEKLGKNAIKESGVFNQEFISKIREKYNNSPLFYARQLWVLLTFQIWYEKFIVREK